MRQHSKVKSAAALAIILALFPAEARASGADASGPGTVSQLPDSEGAAVLAHAVEPRARREAGRHEVTLYPLTAQVNSAWSRHFGLSLGYTWHVTERFSLQAAPFFNYISGESTFQRELIDKASVQADAATALLLKWGATAGIEFSPIDGKFVFGNSILGHFSLSVSVGLGGADTRVQLSDSGYGSSGGRFIGSAGLALRLALGERLALRLEIRDYITTARVAKIDGCTLSDFNAIERGDAPSSGCSADSMSDVERSNARLLLDSTSSSILNQLSFLLGIGILF